MLTFHHVGLLVKDIQVSIAHYTELFGAESISQIFRIDSQEVKVCFVTIGDGSHIELVQPLGEDSPLNNLFKKRVSYYHMAYTVNHFDAAITKLEGMHYKALEQFNSEAFEGKRCVFLFSPEAHLIEIIEK